MNPEERASPFDRFDNPRDDDPIGVVVLTSPPSEPLEDHASRLGRDVRQLLARSDILAVEDSRRGALLELVIAPMRAQTALPKVYVDYTRWTTFIGPNELELVGTTEGASNPIVSLFSAACAVASVFRIVHKTGAPEATFARTSLPLLVDGPDGGAPLPLGTLDLGTEAVALIGCGSIAHAFGWALDGLRVDAGHLSLVDNGTVTERNVRKYLGLTKADVGLPKTATLSRMLQGIGFTIDRRPVSTIRFLNQIATPPALAITCTDTAVSRRDTQARLPGLVLDAWSGNDPLMLQAGVGWRGFGRGGSCLICNHWNNREPHPDREAAARLYGYSARELADAIRDNVELLPRTGFAQVDRTKFVDQGNVCDEVPTVDGRRQYSVPFVAAAAGAMLALELVVLGNPSLWRFRRRAPSLRLGIHPAGSNLFPDRLAPRTGCICRDDDWINAFRRHWPALPFADFVRGAVGW